MSTAIHSWTSLLPTRLKSTASSLASRSSLQKQQLDVSAWELEPPLEDTDLGARKGTEKPEIAPSSGEEKLRRYRTQLAEANEAKRPGGRFFVVQEQHNEPLGESVAWQRRSQPVAGISVEVEGRKAAMLEAWRTRAERGERDGPSGLVSLRDGSDEKIGRSSTGRRQEEMEVRVSEQKEVRLAELRKRTSMLVTDDDWFERMGGAATGRTKEEMEVRAREQAWRRGTKEGRVAADLERRRAGRARVVGGGRDGNQEEGDVPRVRMAVRIGGRSAVLGED